METVPFKRHRLNRNTQVCSCGKTYERHLAIELGNEKMKAKWFEGNVNLEEDFAFLYKLTT